MDRRVTFDLFKDLLGGIPWIRTLEGRGAQDCWLILKHHFLQAQGHREGRRPAWMGKVLLGKKSNGKIKFTDCEIGTSSLEGIE